MWPLNRKTAPSVSLALQGGGAHGAFTWGVLDALLERGIEIAAVSGTSAGALNGVVLAHGLAHGGHEGARAALAAFWQAVGSRMPPGWFHDGDPPGLTTAGRAMFHWARLLSPYQLNPLGINPLRDIVREQVDFDRLRASPGPALFVAATHANSGRLRLFDRDEMTLDAALASACLPALQQAVLIDDEPYWDGGYAANPALFPLCRDAHASDLLVVMLAPLAYDKLPMTAAQIQQRAAEIAFNATFLREARMLAELQALARRALPWRASAFERRLARLRLHVIEAEDTLGALPGETRMAAQGPFLQTLFELGRERALAWWRHHGRELGRRSTADFAALFGEPAPAPKTRAGTAARPA